MKECYWILIEFLSNTENLRLIIDTVLTVVIIFVSIRSLSINRKNNEASLLQSRQIHLDNLKLTKEYNTLSVKPIVIISIGAGKENGKYKMNCIIENIGIGPAYIYDIGIKLFADDNFMIPYEFICRLEKEFDIACSFVKSNALLISEKDNKLLFGFKNLDSREIADRIILYLDNLMIKYSYRDIYENDIETELIETFKMHHLH